MVHYKLLTERKIFLNSRKENISVFLLIFFNNKFPNKKTIIKYIAPEKVESVYMRAEGVSEIFIYGDSF